MSNTQPLAETPPSDEVMKEIVAKWKGWKTVMLDNGIRPHQPFFFDLEDAVDSTVADPRTDLSEAMKLLGWLYFEYDIDFRVDTLWKGEQHVTGWGVGDLDSRDYHIIPLTGPEFRTAVCNLAARVLGVGGE